MGSFDCAAWHRDAPIEKGGTHIAMFLGWVITRDLLHHSHLEDPSSAWYVARIKTRERTAKDFLSDLCRNRLTESEMEPEACAFTASYYTTRYLTDYSRVFTEHASIYDVEDTWENFERIAAILDRRYGQFMRWRARKEQELREAG